MYVQKHMKEDGALIVDLLMNKGGYLFVCGDGAGMAKDVHAALLAALEEHGGLAGKRAEEEVAALVEEKRYVRDVWS